MVQNNEFWKKAVLQTDEGIYERSILFELCTRDLAHKFAKIAITALRERTGYLGFVTDIHRRCKAQEGTTQT